MDKKLTPESEVWYNEDHADVFQLTWDNDLVNLTKKDCIALREILDNWTMVH